jgi:copper transport protein
MPVLVLLLVAWLGTALLAMAPSAAAHTELTSSDPAAGAVVRTAPELISLRFSEGVSLIDGGFRLLSADASQQPTGPATSTGTEVTVPVTAPLADGAYILVYRVVSADTHPISGAVPFTVGAVAADQSATVAAERMVAEEMAVSQVVRALWGIDRWAGLAGVVVLLGVPVFVIFCWPAGAGDPVLRRLTGGGAVVVVVTALASLPLQAAYATGESLSGVFSDGSIPDLLSRSAGRAAAGRAVLVVLFVALLAAAARRGGRGVALAAGLAGAGVLLSYSWAGHPAAAEYPALTMTDDALHLAAAAVWVGGLVCLAFRMLRRPEAGLPDVLRRWSVVAMAAVAVLVATGSVQAWRELRSVSALVDTDYGRWLLAKVLGLVLLVALGDFGRRRVRRYAERHAGEPRQGHGQVELAHTQRVGGSVGAMLAEPVPGNLTALRRSVAAEVVLSAAVLAATAVLVVTTPGRDQTAAAGAGAHQNHPTQSTAGTASAPSELPPAMAAVELPNAVKAEVSVAPPRAGTPTITITVRDLTGAAVDATEVTASAELATAGISGLPIQLARTEPGRYIADGARLPFPGEWRITVTVRTSDVDSGVGTVSVHLQ